MSITYKESLQGGLTELLAQDGVFLLGEDIAEPYGGSFQISKGMSEKFPGKVINTPMSEQAFTGLGVGMALAGYKPIIEIMFGDFVTLTMDQILNHASKFQQGFERKLHLVVRTPMGGYRGYGATHSQSLEKLYMGLPNITVVTPSVLHSPGLLLKSAVELGNPVMFFENKLDYTRKLFCSEKIAENFDYKYTNDTFPTCDLNFKGEKSEIAIITYGGLVNPLITMAYNLYMNEEIPVHFIVPSTLSNVDFEQLKDLVEDSKYIWTIEEGHVPFGFGDAIVSGLCQKGVKSNFRTIGAKQSIIGASKKMEDDVLPNFDVIYKEIVGLFN